MIQKIKNFIYHPLFSGSMTMIIGSNSANFVAYLYHLILGRMLGPASYGELAATVSLLSEFSAVFTFFGLVIVKFVSSSKKKDLENILSWFTQKAVILGVVLLLATFVATPFFSQFLKIKKEVIYLVGPILFFFLLSFILKAYLQGLLKFGKNVIASNLELIARLMFSVILVYFGFSVFGAVAGYLLGAILGFFLSWYFLKEYKIFSRKIVFKDTKNIYVFALPVFLSTLASNSLLTSDLILIKHFFDPQSAGLYAALSTLGKIIFYGTGPISAVMFPLIAKRHSEGKGFKNIFWLSLAATFLISLGMLFLYWLFPDISIDLLYGPKYLEAAGNLVWYGLFITIFSLNSLIVSFYLSVGKTKIIGMLIVAALLQIIGIWFFHNTVLTVIKISIVSVFLLFLGLLIYMGYEEKKASK